MSNTAWDTGSVIDGALSAGKVDGAPIGEIIPDFFTDFYFRVWVRPSSIDVQTVTGEFVAPFYIWNAYPNRSVTLIDTMVVNDTDIEVNMTTPTTIPSMGIVNGTMTIGMEGQSNINAEVVFDFDSESISPRIDVIGSRIVKMGWQAMSRVKEEWVYATEVIESVGGYEQRLSMSGKSARTTINYSIGVDLDSEVRKLEAAMASGGGRLFMPEWQYADTPKIDIVAGVSQVKVNPNRCDARVGEYIMLYDEAGTDVFKVLANDNGLITISDVTPRSYDRKALVIPGANVVIGDVTVKRYPMDHSADVELGGRMERLRDQMANPAVPVTFDRYHTRPILNIRPVSSGFEFSHLYAQRLESHDNGFGVVDAYTLKDEPLIQFTRKYRATHKNGLLNWFKAFADEVMGSSRQFYIPSFRNDLAIVAGAGGDGSITVAHTDYGTRTYFAVPALRNLRLTDGNGVSANVYVAAVTVDGNENSVLSLSANIPPGLGDIQTVEFLMPVRIADDKITLSHDHSGADIELQMTSCREHME